MYPLSSNCVGAYRSNGCTFRARDAAAAPEPAGLVVAGRRSRQPAADEKNSGTDSGRPTVNGRLVNSGTPRRTLPGQANPFASSPVVTSVSGIWSRSIAHLLADLNVIRVPP